VTTRTGVPIVGVEVQLEADSTGAQASYAVRTGASGQFQLADLPAGRYFMTAEAARYAPYLDTVRIDVQKTLERSPILNGIPALNGATFTSSHFRRTFPPPLEFYELFLVAQVDDPDGLADVELVWFELPDLGLVDTLRVINTPGRYEGKLEEADLPDGQPSEVLGRPLVVKIRDRTGYVAESAPQSLIRLIEDIPLTIAPQAGEIVRGDPTPQLSWECSDPPYSHTYLIKILRSDFEVSTLVFTRPGLLPENVCDADGTGVFEVDTALPAGIYSWFVAIVDAFGNASQSRGAGFVLE
jgi:hypothetical protein